MAFIDPQKGSFRPHWANLLPPNAPALAQCPAYLSDPDFYFLERPHLRQKTTIAAPANHSARHAFRLLLSAQGSAQSMSYWFSIPASAPQKRTPSDTRRACANRRLRARGQFHSPDRSRLLQAIRALAQQRQRPWDLSAQLQPIRPSSTETPSSLSHSLLHPA